jgi:hypothetical protein
MQSSRAFVRAVGPTELEQKSENQRQEAVCQQGMAGPHFLGKTKWPCEKSCESRDQRYLQSFRSFSLSSIAPP